MLVRLGDALAAEPGISRVLTMSRGSVDAAVDALTDPPGGHVLAPIPLMTEPTDATNAWPVSVAAERGIRRALTAHGRVDVVHLRMADVGSMAAARGGHRARHPHRVHPRARPARRDPRPGHDRGADPRRLRRGRRAGALLVPDGLVQPARDRRSPLRALPAAGAARPARDLLGIDIDTEPGRYTVVPEGIDVSVSDAARDRVLDAGARAHDAHCSPALDDLPGSLDPHHCRRTGHAGCRSR